MTVRGGPPLIPQSLCESTEFPCCAYLGLGGRRRSGAAACVFAAVMQEVVWLLAAPLVRSLPAVSHNLAAWRPNLKWNLRLGWRDLTRMSEFAHEGDKNTGELISGCCHSSSLALPLLVDLCIWIPLEDHPLKLERYREDEHGPCARMTRTNREVYHIF